MDATTGGVKRFWNQIISMIATKGMIRSLAIWGEDMQRQGGK